jgi:hypothetical protein
MALPVMILCDLFGGHDLDGLAALAEHGQEVGAGVTIDVGDEPPEPSWLGPVRFMSLRLSPTKSKLTCGPSLPTL